MSPTDAAKLLDLPVDATPEQLETRFLELRTKLEDKIAKAPTPGLKAKYRESLDQVTAAFETLTLAADSSSLPVAQKNVGPDRHRPGDGGSPLAATSPTRSAPAPTLQAKPKSGGKEFLIVALIAVLLLGAGGWFVMKTRAENAEKARVAAEAQAAKERQAAEAKAEQERLAEVARVAADAKRKADEAEVARREKTLAQLRADLAETKVTWEAIEREERAADRKLTELKSDLRNLKDATPGRLAEARATVAAHQRFSDWLSETLARHPARVARGKAEELVSARQVDDAAAAMADLKKALGELDHLVSSERKRQLDLDGVLILATDANVAWRIEDAFGEVRTGTGPAEIDGLAVGPATLQLRKPAWPDRTLTVAISADQPARPAATYAGHVLAVTSDPEGATVTDAKGAKLGETPLRVPELPPGKYQLTVGKEGFYPEKLEVTLPSADSPRAVTLRVKPQGFEKPPTWNGPAKVRFETNINTQSTGNYASNTTMRLVEEWDFSDRDPKIGWRRVVRRWVTLSGSNREYMPIDGSAVQLTRQPDGTWTGAFIQGGLKNPEYNKFWTSAPASFWLALFTLQDFFPDKPVPIGGTWSIKPDVFFNTIGLKDANGTVQGRLVNLERTDAVEWADLEFTYSYTNAVITGNQSVMKLRVNVTDGYVTRMELHDSSTARDLKISSTSTTTLSLR